MSESTTTTAAMTPREADAWRLWTTLEGDDRNYATVAKRMGGITEGRAGVYVREAFKKASPDEQTAHPLPRTGGGGGGGGRKKATVQTGTEKLETVLAEYDAQVESLTARISEAEEAAAKFDAEQWKEAEAKRLDEAAKAARDRATAFKKNEKAEGDELGVADLAAKAHGEQLTERVKTVRADSEEQVEKARAAREEIAKALETLKALSA